MSDKGNCVNHLGFQRGYKTVILDAFIHRLWVNTVICSRFCRFLIYYGIIGNVHYFYQSGSVAFFFNTRWEGKLTNMKVPYKCYWESDFCMYTLRWSIGMCGSAHRHAFDLEVKCSEFDIHGQRLSFVHTWWLPDEAQDVYLGRDCRQPGRKSLVFYKFIPIFSLYT